MTSHIAEDNAAAASALMMTRAEPVRAPEIGKTIARNAALATDGLS